MIIQMDKIFFKRTKSNDAVLPRWVISIIHKISPGVRFSIAKLNIKVNSVIPVRRNFDSCSFSLVGCKESNQGGI